MATDQRLQVSPGLLIPKLQPFAAPVPTFIEPTAGRSLDQLGNALAQISPEVRAFVGATSDHIDANAQQEGRQAAESLREQGLSLAEATRKGKLPASHNPWYMAGLREQLGRNMADTYDGDLRAATNGDTSVLDKIGAPELATDAENLSSSTNIADFDAFASKFRAAWSKANLGPQHSDDRFALGFQFRADAVETQARNSFASGVENKAVAQGDDATFGEAYKEAYDRLAAGNADPARIAADLNALTSELVKQGRNGARTMQAVARGVATAAINANSLAGAEILKSLSGKSGPSPAAVALYDSTVEKIQNNLWTANQRETITAAQATAKHTASVLSTATAALVKDPHADLSQYIGQLNNDPDAAGQLENLRRNINGLTYSTDQATFRSLYSDIWSEGSTTTQRTIIRALNAGKLDVSDANSLMIQLDTRERSQTPGDPVKAAVTDFAFVHELETIKSRFADPITGIVKADQADRAAHASAVLIDRWTNLNTSGEAAKMSTSQRDKWLSDMADSIVRYERGPDAMTISPAPAASFGGTASPLPPLEQRLPKTAVLTPEDLQAFARGVPTDHFRAVATQLGLTEEEQSAFIRSQLPLVLKKRTP